MSKYYRYKDVLIGLKEEYQRMREELQKLNEYVSITERDVKDIEFSLYHSESGPLLDYTLIYNDSLLRKIFNTTRKEPFYSLENGYIVRTNADYSWLDWYSKFGGYTDRKAFINKLEEIKKSLFCSNMTVKNAYDAKGKELFFSSSINGTSLYNFDNHSRLDLYDNDTIKLSSEEPSDIFRLFESPVPSEILTDYQIKAIERQNPEYYKDVYIDADDKADKSTKYAIEQEDNYIILKRVK